MNINNILIVDTETTGLDIDAGAQIIEVAAILYNVQHRTIVQQFSTLCAVDENPQYKVNKINANATQKVSLSIFANTLTFLEALVKESSIIVAHNAEFDKKFLSNWVVDFGFKDKQWVCSCHDFAWPDMQKGKRLIDICLELGIPVVSAHRALTDCQLLAACFDKLDDLEARLEAALIPRYIYKAMTSFEERHIPKEAGFIWDRLVPGAWAARLTEHEAKSLTFKVKKIDNSDN